MMSIPFPVFDSVIAWLELVVATTWLAKVRLLGERTAMPLVVTPVPVSATVWGLPVAESLMLTLPERVPAAVGAKLTLIVQADPAAKLAGQLLAAPKSPVAWIDPIVRLAFPVLDSVTT